MKKLFFVLLLITTPLFAQDYNISKDIVRKTASFTLLEHYKTVIIDSTSGAVVVTLPNQTTVTSDGYVRK